MSKESDYIKDNSNGQSNIEPILKSYDELLQNAKDLRNACYLNCSNVNEWNNNYRISYNALTGEAAFESTVRHFRINQFLWYDHYQKAIIFEDENGKTGFKYFMADLLPDENYDLLDNIYEESYVEYLEDTYLRYGRTDKKYQYIDSEYVKNNGGNPNQIYFNYTTDKSKADVADTDIWYYQIDLSSSDKVLFEVRTGDRTWIKEENKPNNYNYTNQIERNAFVFLNDGLVVQVNCNSNNGNGTVGTITLKDGEDFIFSSNINNSGEIISSFNLNLYQCNGWKKVYADSNSINNYSTIVSGKLETNNGITETNCIKVQRQNESYIYPMYVIDNNSVDEIVAKLNELGLSTKKQSDIKDILEKQLDGYKDVKFNGKQYSLITDNEYSTLLDNYMIYYTYNEVQDLINSNNQVLSISDVKTN